MYGVAFVSNMELHLEVVLLSTIKRRKPWPRFCWLGLEKESVFLLDDSRVSEINMVSGRTKRKTPKLQPLLQRTLTTAAAQNGMWLAGLLISGEVFLWSKDRGCVKMINTAPSVSQLVTAAHEGSVRLSLLVSGDGRRLLLSALTGQVFLWECVDRPALAGTRDGTVKGLWQQILPSDTTSLPSSQNKEASQNSVFAQGEVGGDCCLTAFVFTVGTLLTVTFLKIQWEESMKFSSPGYSVRWITQTYPLPQLAPPCRPLRSRGALVPAFSPDGRLLAVALNQRDPRATQVLFISTQNFVTVSSWLGGCGSKNLSIPSKYVRSYWVACMSWAPGGLYLACVLKRGSLLLLARLGGLVSLSTSGCSVELGPAHFLPLHPLVTCSLPALALPPDESPTSSLASAQDGLRQRYSVTWHPRLPYLIVSDGYMASVLRVPLQANAAALVSALLLRCAEGLERVRKRLGSAKPQVLDSMPTLKLTAGLQELRKQEAILSTLPLFLRDDSDTTGTTQLYAGSPCAGEEDSDDEGGQFPAARVGDRGRLEFASMFDTLHAHPASGLDDRHDPEETSDPEVTSDSEEAAQTLLGEVEDVHRSLLTAWALGLSTGGASEDRGRLMRSAVRCAVRLARLLLVSPPRGLRRGEKLSTPGRSHLWPLLKNLYSLLPWDAQHGGAGGCLGVAVDLTRRIMELILSPLPDSPKHGCPPGRFSQTLSSALVFLRMAARSLDLTYSPPQGASALPSDVVSVPLLKEEDENGVSQNALCTRRQPSSRLLEVWRGLYGQVLQYQEDMVSQTGHAQSSAEQGQIAAILCQIQQVLQEYGDRLGDGPTLHRATGEEHFLSGSYAESARVWRAELCAENERGGPMLCILETRFCLALLYGHLFQYQLHQALGLCEHLAQQLIPRARLEGESGAESAMGVERPWEACLPVAVGPEAACAVVQSFGRFMAAYFTNQPLTILPPHSVGVLPPLHLPAGSAPGQRLVPLSRSTVLGEVRRQQLSEVWTVDYALELLLQGGLLPEAVWLAHSLGDWKTAASLGLAYTTYCREQADFSRLQWRELCLPAHLQPGSLFQGQLEQLLGLQAENEPEQRAADGRSYQRFADSVLEEDSELQVWVQEVLKASVMAQEDVLSQPLLRLVDAAKDLTSHLSGLVPSGVYLPAPPLYCPQPASDTQVSVGDFGVVLEGRSRQCISGVLQRALLLLGAANCSLPAAQWYISNLQQRRQLLHKKLSQPLNPFPEGLKEFVTSGTFFSGTNGEGHLDNVTVQVIACFREVCGLCWMLHVRDQLSVSCRKYQAARTQMGLSQGSDSAQSDSGSDVVQRCTDALRWACRLLPFSRFLKAEEVLQDLVLSLVSELPPTTMVVDVMAQVFPEEEESVQVSLRDKYSTLLQQLRHCTLPVSELGSAEPERETMVTVLIQQKLVHRCQVQRKISKHLAPLKRQIWERIEDEEEEERAIDRFSPSRSTLSDFRCSPQSNGNRTATPTDNQETPVYSRTQQSGQTWSDRPGGGRPVERGNGRSSSKQAVSGPTGSGALPPVGSWEFELLDEEYPRFLELFLSYVLERDCAEDKDSALPLLSGFSPLLREAELHSLAFDVLTTLKRRQGSVTGRRPGHTPPPQTPSQLLSSSLNLPLQSEALVRSSPAYSVPPPGPRAGKPLGLFGLRRLSQPMKATRTEGPRAGSEADRSSAVRTPQPDCKALPAPPTPDLPRPEARFQNLSRLLEWMIRWADRRVRGSHPAPRGGAAGPEGVVMRAKASTPAVLTALRVLEGRYTAALLAADQHCPSVRVPEGEFTAALLQPEKERTGHPGCAASSGSTVSLPPLESLHGEVSEVSELEEVETETDMGRAVHQYSQEGAFGSRPESRPMNTHGGSKDDTTDLLEPEGESRREDAVYTSGSASCISVQIKTVSRGPRPSHQQTLTLADLVSDREETEGDSSHQTSVEVPDPDPDPAPAQEPNIQTGPVPGLHPGPQVPSFPSSSTSQLGRSPEALPPPAAADPFRQLVQDQMFRLVQFQQMSFISLLQTVAASFPNPSQLNQNPIPTDHLSQLNQSQYPIPTANLPPLDHTQYPIPTENLPQLNQSQYPIPPANLPPLNHPQYPIPTANQPLLIQTQNPIPTANPPLLIQTHQPGAPFFPPRPDPHQFGPQNQGPVPTPPHALERLHREQNLGPDPETQPWAGQADELELLRSVSPSSESQSLGNMESLSEELPVRLEELRGTQAERGSACVTPVHHQGVALLCAAGSSAAPPPAPTGLRLLQLPPHSSLPSPAVPTGLLYSSAVPPLPREAFVHPRTDPPVLPREGGRGWRKPAQRAFEVPPDPSVRQVAQPKLPDGPGQGSGQGGPLQLILAPPSPRQPLPRGLPLLRFHPEPRLPAPPVPFTTPATPLISVPSPPGFPEVPGHPAFPAFSSGIQLLQRAPDQPSKVLLGRVAWAPECGERAGPRLLTVASQAHPAQDTLASSKRQKRREEREQEGQSRNLGRPEGSSISPTEADKAEPSGSALEEDVADESASSVLAGPDLISRALSTAAELHAFASTQKRPPQLHDASTNTDSGAGRVETAAAACPGVLLNLQFPREAESVVQQGPDTVSAGRHFINVINLEDEDLLEHLPSRQASASPTGPTPTPVSPHTHRPGAPVPNHTSTEQMTAETVLDTQLEPSERPSPPVIPGLWGISEPGQDKEPLGLLVEIEPLSLPNSSRLGLGLRDSLGLSVSFRDVEEQSDSSGGGVGRSADPFDSMMERSGRFSDGPLDLSDMGDTLTESVGLRGASTYSLGPSDTLRDRFLRRGEQNDMGVEEEEQREELRAWMKKKQKERIAEYRRQREEKREQEHRPFTPSSTQNLTSRDLSTNKKMKEKKEKTLLLEHHTLRAREACSLITELLKPSPALPTLTKAQPSQSTNQSSRRPKAHPSQSTNQSSRRPKAHPSQSTNHSCRRAAPHGSSRPEGRRGRGALFHTSASPGRTAGVRSISAQRGEHQPTTRRLHRPGALPDARLTRWGVQDTRGRRPGKGWMKGIRPPLKEDRMRREREVREEMEEESDDEQLLSPWNPPLEIRRLLGLDNQGSVEERRGAPGSGAGVWLKGLDRDSPSESTGSILSKLDWTAIEKMVAEENQV